MGREQQQTSQRAEKAGKLWVYLDRYRDAMDRKYSPKTIECAKRKLFRSECKTVEREAWLISTCDGGVDAAGNRIIYRLWVDYTSRHLWWQPYGDLARRVTLGENNPPLSAEENLILEAPEEDMAHNLGALATRNGIDILAPDE